MSGVQRGGTPTAHDRVPSTRYGVAAIDAVVDRDYGTMVALQSDEIVRVPLSEVVGRPESVSPQPYEDGAPWCFG